MKQKAMEKLIKLDYNEFLLFIYDLWNKNFGLIQSRIIKNDNDLFHNLTLERKSVLKIIIYLSL